MVARLRRERMPPVNAADRVSKRNANRPSADNNDLVAFFHIEPLPW